MIRNAATSIKVIAVNVVSQLPVDDLGNLTVKYRLNATGSFANIADQTGSLDSAHAGNTGDHTFAVTAAETNGYPVEYEATSSTSNIQCICVPTIAYPISPGQGATGAAINYLDIFQGDAYLRSQGTARTLSFVFGAGERWPDTISEAHFYAEPTDQLLDNTPAAASLSAIVAVVVVATGDAREIVVELTEANTGSLSPGVYRWWLVANEATDDATVRSGTMLVRKKH